MDAAQQVWLDLDVAGVEAREVLGVFVGDRHHRLPDEHARVKALELLELVGQVLLADDEDGRARGLKNVAHQLDTVVLYQVVHLVDDERLARDGELLGDLIGELVERLAWADAHLLQDCEHERLAGPDAFGRDVIRAGFVGCIGRRGGFTPAGRTIQCNYAGQVLRPNRGAINRYQARLPQVI